MKTLKYIPVMMTLMLIISGCVESEPVFTPNGQRGYNVDCSGGDSDWGECYEEAGELCGTRGYRIIEKMTDKGSSTYADDDVLTGETYNTRTMIIQCK